MEAHVHYTFVGVVVMGLVGMLIGFMLWLARAGEEGSSTYYLVYFERFSLSGLQVDSPVTMRGIRVGNVRNLKISPKDIERVSVLLKIQADTPVKTDTRAIVQRNLLTGIANIELTPGTRHSTLLDEPPPNEDYPVITEGHPQFEKIQSDLPELLENANELVRNGAKLFSTENREKAQTILNNLERITGRLAKNDAEIEKALQGMAGLADSANRLLEALNKRSQELSQSVSGASDVFTREATQLLEDIRAAAQKLSTAAEAFENPREALFGGKTSELAEGSP